MAPTDEEGWVTDPDALKTILALRGLEVGDVMRWYQRGNPRYSETHTIKDDNQVANLINYFTNNPELKGWVLCAWRRPKQHSS